MRKLYILRGIPASGKSTFIKENNLEPFVLSADHLRNQFESLNYNLDGKPVITQDNNNKVWKLLFELLENKMNKGCLAFVDATHCSYKSIKQ